MACSAQTAKTTATDELKEFLINHDIPEAEHIVLTGQGIKTIQQFGRAITSETELSEEIIVPLSTGKIDEKDLHANPLDKRKRLLIKATWTLAWEDAAMQRNEELAVKTMGQPEAQRTATPQKTSSEKDKAESEIDERAPKRLKPGEFSARIKELCDVEGINVEVKLIQGCDDILAKMRHEKEKSLEFSTPDLVALMNSRRWASDGTAVTPSSEKAKWQHFSSHNAITDVLETLDAALAWSGWQANTFGTFFRFFKEFSRARDRESLTVRDTIYAALTEITARMCAGKSFTDATEAVTGDSELMKKLYSAKSQNPRAPTRWSPRRRSRSRSQRRTAHRDGREGKGGKGKNDKGRSGAK